MPTIREDTDFSTYQADHDDRNSGWNWYCMHCADGRGWRWERRDARRAAREHVADRPVPPGDTATAVENVLSAESELRAQRDILTVALERVRAEFFDIDEEPFEGHVSADVSRAIVAKIDNALSAARG